MKKILSISAIALFIIGIVVWVTISIFFGNIVIKNIKSDYFDQSEYSEYFQEKFLAYDYQKNFDNENDIIIVNYDNGYVVNYYSTRSISADEAGYIQACIKMAGTLKSDGQLYPSRTEIHSDVYFDDKYEIASKTRYSVSSNNKDNNDESLSYDIEENHIINGNPEQNNQEDFTIEKADSTDEWKKDCINNMYESYMECSGHFNGN